MEITRDGRFDTWDKKKHYLLAMPGGCLAFQQDHI
jgi:hypothetical protein